jgi:hypothetical protein
MEALETIVDKVGISETVRMLAEVCEEKAEQATDDEELADIWNNAADDLNDLDFNEAIE